MTDVNPYSTPANTSSEVVGKATERPTTKQLWIAYVIAPLLAPLGAALAVFVLAFAYQALNPNDVDVNPLSMILAPALLLVLGIPASYGVAGLIGMPIAFWLRSRDKLNAFTVHGAALLWVAVLGVGFALLGMLLSPLGEQDAIFANGLELLGASVGVFVGLAPFIMLSATAFWLIGVRRRQQPQVATDTSS